MRFIIMVKATADSEAGKKPAQALLASMATYHEALQKAGVLLDASGLQSSAKGWRVHYANGEQTMTEGPFADTEELIAGYTVIQVRSREEAMEWSRRFPAPFGENGDGEIEVRQMMDLDDFEPGQSMERFRKIEGANH
ncbi:YciI family protein [Paraburkholderia phymatum]|uniref:DGPFAETKE family protein n=1 Tax=Paraburkholderia phymatum (strain DSM 17167 / CIP 108236 / LMG 21445 / STM815) TaxID=391038 RepID=B2JPN1_PARP8|nr:YciI family protein [Paraburkholderia phymatum]ACC73222.1 DGPFAETKE family protein [Paraburkholderia phymatum STM815]